ncbi:MAG: ComEC/Rec2 family competence protein [Pirellulales bacterium]
MAVALAAGIALDRAEPLPATVWWLGAAVALVLWRALARGPRERASAIVLLVAVALAGAAWHHTRWQLFSPDEVGRDLTEESAPIAIELLALEAPRRVAAGAFNPMRAVTPPERSRLTARVLQVRDGATWRAAVGATTLSVDGHLLGVHAGDRLRVFGQMSRPRSVANPGQFDFARHLRADRQLTLLGTDLPDAVSVVERGSRWSWRRALDELRGSGARSLDRHVRHQRSALAAALLLGLRERLDLDRHEAFLATGTIHVLSISGLHVGLVAAGVFLLLRLGLVRRRAALLVAVLATSLYTLLTDADTPAVRALVLVLATCAALALGRRAAGFNLLGAAAIVTLLLNPADLFRSGAQLSFLAVAALFWAGPRVARPREPSDPVDRLIWQSAPWPVWAARWGREALVRTALLSLAVWGVTLPLVAARFHIVAPAGLPLNLLLWIPVGLTLLSGFGVILCGWLLPPLAVALGWICDVNLQVMEWFIAAGAGLPAGHLWVTGPSDWWLTVLYAGLACWATWPRYRPPQRWLWGAIAGWCAVGFLAANPDRALPDWQKRLGRSEGELRCTFLSVGHGLSVLLELPDGRTLLYDAGHLGAPEGAARVVAGALWQRGHARLDAASVSHADIDHYNALPDLMERFGVGTLFVSPMMFEEPSAAVKALSDACQQRDVAITTISAGDRLRVGGDCRLEVLHPTREGELGSDNANSLVLLVEYRGRRILLTGDLETPGLNAVLAEAPLDCDVLLAPHHGSARSNPPGMVAWCRPEWVVISGGQGGDRDGAVERAYAADGAQVLHTAVHGAVTVTVNAEAIRVETWRPE